MEENFIKDIKLIIEELQKEEYTPEKVKWNDHRSSAQNKEIVYENSREGELLLILNETTDLKKREELLSELENVRKEKKENLVNELNSELEKIKKYYQKEQNTIDRKLEYAKKMVEKVRRIIKSNNELLKNRNKESKVYVAAKEENATEIEKKNRLSNAIKNLENNRKQIEEKLAFYNSINLKEDGIDKLKSIVTENESKKDGKNKDDTLKANGTIKNPESVRTSKKAYVGHNVNVSKKENIFKRLSNKIKSFKIGEKIKKIISNVKYGFEVITGKTKLLDKSQKIDLGIRKDNQEESKNENISNYLLDELLNNSANLSLEEKHAIADYANTYGEKEAIQRFRGELISAEIGLNVQKMLNQENEFKERLNVKNEDGKIEKKANEKINSRNVIEKMKAAAKKSIPIR